MKLKFKSAEEFRRLLTRLLDDLVDAQFHFCLHQNLVKVAEEYAVELGQSPTFWNLTLSAHQDAVITRLCRAYETYGRSALNLQNLLDTIKANLSMFEVSNFRERLRGNAFVDSLASSFTPPDQVRLQEDTELVSKSDPLVYKLLMWRHKHVAHRDSHFMLNPMKLSKEYPLSYPEVDTLLSRALEIGNRYSLLFDASAQSTMMVGRDDYLNVLEAVREHVKTEERHIEEDLKQSRSL